MKGVESFIDSTELYLKAGQAYVYIDDYNTKAG